MKKLFALLLALALVAALTGCGGSSAPADEAAEADAPETAEAAGPTEESEPEPTEEPEATVEAGTYMYYEDKGDFGVIPWTIVLNEDGTATVTEANSFIGDQVHNCESWSDNYDGTFTTGAWDEVGGPMSEFFAEDGSATWEIPEDGICQPVGGTPSADASLVEAAASSDLADLTGDGPPEDGPEGEEAPESDSEGAVTAGVYTYEEDKGDFGVIPWTIALNEDGTATVTEANSFIGDQVHNCESWSDNGDGTFTTGAWDEVGGPMSEFFAEDGSATWTVTGEWLCEPVV